MPIFGPGPPIHIVYESRMKLYRWWKVRRRNRKMMRRIAKYEKKYGRPVVGYWEDPKFSSSAHGVTNPHGWPR